jgi:hypothetical protein
VGRSFFFVIFSIELYLGSMTARPVGLIVIPAVMMYVETWPVGLIVIPAVMMYVETLKTNIIVSIGNIIMCLPSH